MGLIFQFPHPPWNGQVTAMATETIVISLTNCEGKKEKIIFKKWKKKFFSKKKIFFSKKNFFFEKDENDF